MAPSARLPANQSTIGLHFAAVNQTEDAFMRDEAGPFYIHELLQKIKDMKVFADEEVKKLNLDEQDPQGSLAELVAAQEAELAALLNENEGKHNAINLLITRSSKLNYEGLKKKEVIFAHLERVFGDVVEELRRDLRALDLENSVLQSQINAMQNGPESPSGNNKVDVAKIIQDLTLQNQNSLHQEVSKIQASLQAEIKNTVHDSNTIKALRTTKDINESELLLKSQTISLLTRERDLFQANLSNLKATDEQKISRIASLEQESEKWRSSAEKLEISSKEKDDRLTAMGIELEEEKYRVSILQNTPKRSNEEVRADFLDKQELVLLRNANDKLRKEAANALTDTTTKSETIQQLTESERRLQREVDQLKTKAEGDDAAIARLTREVEDQSGLKVNETHRAERAEEEEELLMKTVLELEDQLSESRRKVAEVERAKSMTLLEKTGLRAKLTELQSKLRNTEASNTNLKTEKSNIADDLAKFKSQLEQYQSANTRWSTEYDRIKTELGTVEKQREDYYKELSISTHTVARKEKEILGLNRRVSTLETEVGALQQDLKAAEDTEQLIWPDNTPYEETHKDCLARQKTQVNRIDELESEKYKNQKLYNELSSTHSRCGGNIAEKESTIVSQQLAISAKEEEVRKMTTKHKDCSGLLDAAMEQLEACQSKLSKVEEEHSKCPSATRFAELEEQNHQLQTKLDQTPDFEKQLTQMKDIHSTCPKASDVSSARDEIKELQIIAETHERCSSKQSELEVKLQKTNEELELLKVAHAECASARRLVAKPVRPAGSQVQPQTPRVAAQDLAERASHTFLSPILGNEGINMRSTPFSASRSSSGYPTAEVPSSTGPCQLDPIRPRSHFNPQVTLENPRVSNGGDRNTSTPARQYFSPYYGQGTPTPNSATGISTPFITNPSPGPSITPSHLSRESSSPAMRVLNSGAPFNHDPRPAAASNILTTPIHSLKGPKPQIRSTRVLAHREPQ
jgi:chromosome segregation ATPase